MRDEANVPRWSEDGSEAPPGLRRMLEASRRQTGTPQEIAQLSRQLSGVLGPEAGVPVPASSLPAGKAGLAAGRWATWLVAGAGGAAALWISTRPPPPPSAPSAPPRAPSEAPSASEWAPMEPVLAPPSPPAVAELEPERAHPPARSRPRAPARNPAGPAEAELLQRAQQVLGAQPAKALALTGEHRRRFPSGILAEEREVIAIEALRRLGRESAARARAAAFDARYPDSVHQQRVRGSAAPPEEP